MSADLFAAFGTNPSHEGEDHTGGLTEDVTRRSDAVNANTWQPWPRSLQHTTQQVRREDLWRSHEDTDVLFDADEDDFGDFEQAELNDQISIPKVAKQTTVETSIDLLELGDEQATEQHSIGQPSSASKTSDQSQLAQHNSQENNDWGDFEDIEATESETHTPGSGAQADLSHKQPALTQSIRASTKAGTQQNQYSAPKSQQLATSSTNDEWDEWDDIDSNNTPTSKIAEASPVAVSTRQERPTNVPPPAVLLSLVPKVVSLLSSTAGSSQQSTETGSQAAEAYRVSARLIAGRALRWKRDTFLAQSMRIGAAGRSGGMKLTALDKGENRKEEQEVEEVLAAWSRHSLKLNVAMAKAKVQKPPLSLSNNVAVRTANGPDILNANHPCPICGLRRNERISGIDVSVSDTFGEFWVEHWGHKGCYDYWYRYETLLDQR